ncbi:ABC transporter substrate-binding protein [Kineothrix sp. MB12-C1]|uniref:ABC transporter substrate-binding protein n=1 Tax=Kineothrix sp. MB12-C1 TaxID=3070215 RepID=UPI0027D2B456|nr:extracellular solute-binding protein [Kineothrix sp. MB12-C1]WMC93052.1 extracellular solute-binding protein [Kineothrix sp. MB12-C1]
MKRKFINYYILYCILAVTIFLCGCENRIGTADNQKDDGIKAEETTYLAQPLSLPEYASLDGAYSDGNNLHYAAAKLDQTSQKYETAFYILKEGEKEPKMLFLLPENQRVFKMTMDKDENIYYLGYEEFSSDDDNLTISDIILYKLDQRGTPLLVLDLTNYMGGVDQSMVQGIAVDGEKRIILFASNQNIYVFDSSGSLLFKVKADGRIYDICCSNGKIFAAYDGIDGIEIKVVDILNKKLSSKLAQTIPGNQFHMVSDSNENLLMATENSVYTYNLETEEIIKKFDWQTYDSTGITAGILLPFREKGVLAINRDYTSFPMKVEATFFKEAVEGESIIPEKTVLTLGTDYSLSNAMNQGIVAFNHSNSDYKIEIKIYNENYAQLNTEIIAGNGPDILVLSFDKIDQLSAKNVLEDLNPYFSEDVTLDRDDFLENILNSFETDGHIYGMPFSFNIDTLVGKTSILKDKSSWNLDELIAFTESFPKGTDIFVDTSKSGVFHLLKTAYTSQLVDMNNMEIPLNRELLIKMLTFANRYEDDERYTYNGLLDIRAMDGQLILLDTNVFSGITYRACSDSVFGEPVTFIGYPTVQGNGNLINCEWALAINSSSKYKDTAWTLISMLLSEEIQAKIERDLGSMGFPIRKDSLEEHFIHVAEWEYNDFLINYNFLRQSGKPAIEEEIEPIRNLIQSADTAFRSSPDIDKIIEEESIFYFNGTKPVEEVVNVIENRIRTYVNENN